MASIDSSLSDEKSSSELLQNMVNNAMIANKSQQHFLIKQELDGDEDLELDDNSQISSPMMSSIQTNNTEHPLSSLISTSGIAKIPIETSSVVDDQSENIGINGSSNNIKSMLTSTNYMQLHCRRPRIRVIHNPSSKTHPLRVCKQTNYIQVESTVIVPRLDDIQGQTRSPSSSPLETSSTRRNPIPQFASWLSEHFKQYDGDVFSKKSTGQYLTNPSNSVIKENKKLSKNIYQSTTSKTLQNQPKLPQFLTQFSNNSSSHIVNSKKTVEIPANDINNCMDSELNAGRKSQRLIEKVKEPIRQDISTSQVARNDQFKELKNEIFRMRKQMCRDRCRFIDECKAMRKEFESLKQILLLSLHLNRSNPSSNDIDGEETANADTTRFYANLNRKRGASNDNDNEEHEIKRQC